jgi:hypothetical protein
MTGCCSPVDLLRGIYLVLSVAGITCLDKTLLREVSEGRKSHYDRVTHKRVYTTINSLLYNYSDIPVH